jgi:hypothetical protein
MILLLLAACGSPTHLQYDFGRANWQAQQIQTDLARPSAAEAVYPLTGDEALKIRHNVESASTDEESGQAEVVAQ